MRSLACLFLIAWAASLHAGPRSSTSYRIVTDSADKGGAGSSSAAYSHSGSVGDVVGISTTPTTTAKQGYLGQLYEVTTLQLAAASASLNELGTLQLGATPWLDDLTTFALTPQEVVWSVGSGALTGIDGNGLATAAVVYQNSAATALGSYGGISGTLSLSVLDSIADNFGSYAGDRLADGWQVQFFGLNSAQGGPGGNPDGDGTPNLLEFAFGTNPNAANAGTVGHAAGVITERGLPTTSVRNIVNGVDFRAVFMRRKDFVAAGLQYQVQFSGDLTSWATSGAVPTVVASDEEMDVVTVPYPFFVNGKKARFFRVSVDFAP
jgi:hypothetical protein